jgi:hypothetical protein
MLGINWVHPKEMPVVEESVRAASWLPRVADFKEYNRLLEEGGMSQGCASPMMEDGVSAAYSSPSTGQQILGDRTNIPEQMTPSTPVVRRKMPIDGTRKSARKAKPSARSTEVNLSAGSTSPSETPTYKPRRSKYDIR